MLEPDQRQSVCSLELTYCFHISSMVLHFLKTRLIVSLPPPPISFIVTYLNTKITDVHFRMLGHGDFIYTLNISVSKYAHVV